MANEREATPRTDQVRQVDDLEIATSADAAPFDPADDIPVPIAMSAAELDERAQAVEAVRGTNTTPSIDDTGTSDSQPEA